MLFLSPIPLPSPTLRQGKRVFNGPAQGIDPVKNVMRGEPAKHFCQFGQPASYAVYGVKSVLIRISLLLLSSSPSAIFRGIAFEVIDPVKRKILTRTPPHVGKKILKALPSLAYLYIVQGVMRSVSIFWNSASALHVAPSISFDIVSHGFDLISDKAKVQEVYI